MAKITLFFPGNLSEKQALRISPGNFPGIAGTLFNYTDSMVWGFINLSPMKAWPGGNDSLLPNLRPQFPPGYDHRKP